MKDSVGDSSYHIDLDGIVAKIKEHGYVIVLLQVPEGLKRIAAGLSFDISDRTGAEVVIDGDICYGACDHSAAKAASLGMEALIHLGHEPIPSMAEGPIPVHFFPVHMREIPTSLKTGIDSLLSKVPPCRIAIVTTAQHRREMEVLKRMLEEKGFHVVSTDPSGRVSFPGQILGCSFESARSLAQQVDTVLYIGTGRFHPLGLVMSLSRDVNCLDPMNGKLTILGMEEVGPFIRKRAGVIASAEDSLANDRRIGIVFTPKPGQARLELAHELKGLCREHGLMPHFIMMDMLEPMKLRSLGFKVAVSTACPRIVTDDGPRYLEEGVHLLSPPELRILLKEESMASYRLDEEW